MRIYHCKEIHIKKKKIGIFKINSDRWNPNSAIQYHIEEISPKIFTQTLRKLGRDESPVKPTFQKFLSSEDDTFGK
ncbi:hypothetical protein [Fortiea sp. LEGE XX443]|uniref:hypothetical protein n=1 Tax=Fortiea sp. LEGE XX443 TaxID=1828611 RepID=UPI00187E33EB|nr:hypothetical protein [Fortiea sp. LEGE XX443]